MKTKTIKLRTSHLDLEKKQIFFNLSIEEFEDLYRAWGRLTTNLSIEIPIPEPKKEITPSDIDNFNRAWWDDHEDLEAFAEYLKVKLFPGWDE